MNAYTFSNCINKKAEKKKIIASNYHTALEQLINLGGEYETQYYLETIQDDITIDHPFIPDYSPQPKNRTV